MDANHESDEAKMADLCRQLSDISAGIPWALLSAGGNFATFQRQFEIACEAGASGFVAGRAIWQETLELADAAARDSFLNTIAVSRSRVLADTASYRATPWFDRVADRMPRITSGWHVNYYTNGEK